MSHRPPISDWQVITDPCTGLRWISSPSGELWTFEQMVLALNENVKVAGEYELAYLDRLTQHLEESLEVTA